MDSSVLYCTCWHLRSNVHSVTQQYLRLYFQYVGGKVLEDHDQEIWYRCGPRSSDERQRRERMHNSQNGEHARATLTLPISRQKTEESIPLPTDVNYTWFMYLLITQCWILYMQMYIYMHLRVHTLSSSSRNRKCDSRALTVITRGSDRPGRELSLCVCVRAKLILLYSLLLHLSCRKEIDAPFISLYGIGTLYHMCICEYGWPGQREAFWVQREVWYDLSFCLNNFKEELY